jgi:hypothetical protein
MSSKPVLKIDWATHKAARFACENWHYSKCMPAGKIVKLGVWEDSTFIGVILFSRGANNTLGKPYGLEQVECCELTRIALSKHQTPVSRIMMISLMFLKKNSPGIRLIVSFADPDRGHHGGVYQATNWIYAGMTNAADEYIVNGKRMHGRSMRALYGSHVGKQFIHKVKGSSKHRYLMPLDEEIRKKVKSLAKPYPKRASSRDNAAPCDQQGEGGASPTDALQVSNDLL